MSALSPLLQLAVALPVLVVLCARRQVSVAAGLAAAAFFVIEGLLLRVPGFVPGAQLVIGHWNWTGKLLAIGGSCAAVYAMRRRGADDLVRWPRSGTLRPVIAAALVLLALAILMGALSRGATFDGETLAFQATLPGLDEELAFRGVLLALLLPPGPMTMRTSWLPVVAVAMLFGAVHGVNVSNAGTVVVDPGYFAWTTVVGCTWGWMTIQTRSILPAMLSHNAGNVVGYLMTLT